MYNTFLHYLVNSAEIADKKCVGKKSPQAHIYFWKPFFFREKSNSTIYAPLDASVVKDLKKKKLIYKIEILFQIAVYRFIKYKKPLEILII